MMRYTLADKLYRTYPILTESMIEKYAWMTKQLLIWKSMIDGGHNEENELLSIRPFYKKFDENIDLHTSTPSIRRCFILIDDDNQILLMKNGDYITFDDIKLTQLQDSIGKQLSEGIVYSEARHFTGEKDFWGLISFELYHSVIKKTDILEIGSFRVIFCKPAELSLYSKYIWVPIEDMEEKERMKITALLKT